MDSYNSIVTGTDETKILIISGGTFARLGAAYTNL